MSKRERGLGRGLDALFSSPPNLDNAEEINKVDINLLIPREEQPRKMFNEETLNELAASIKEHGILQPILVRPREDKYEIIAGERRYRAAKIANLEMLPVIIKQIDDDAAWEIALIENLQREDLSVIEEALAYKGMVNKFGYVQEVIAEKVGKSRAHVANTLRILTLPEEVLQMLEDKQLTPGHARTLLTVKDPLEQIKRARQITADKMSVREAERKSAVKTTVKDIPIDVSKSVEIAEIEEKLQKHLGTKAEIFGSSNGGRIHIVYYSQEDLERIIELLGLD